MLEKLVVGSNMLCYKSLLFSTVSAFQKKIVLPASSMEHLNEIETWHLSAIDFATTHK